MNTSKPQNTPSKQPSPEALKMYSQLLANKAMRLAQEQNSEANPNDVLPTKSLNAMQKLNPTELQVAAKILALQAQKLVEALAVLPLEKRKELVQGRQEQLRQTKSLVTDNLRGIKRGS